MNSLMILTIGKGCTQKATGAALSHRDRLMRLSQTLMYVI